MIIHITGFSGSGKTTLGKEITEKYDIIHKDLDDFINDILLDYYDPVDIQLEMEKKIQEFIDTNDGDIIFTGIGHLAPSFSKELYPRIKADHKIWLDVDIYTSTKRAIIRHIKYYHESLNIDEFMNLTESEINAELTYLNPKYLIREWKDLDKIYKKLNYKTMTKEKILNLLLI